jgi:hypothetical protein
MIRLAKSQRMRLAGNVVFLGELKRYVKFQLKTLKGIYVSRGGYY